jgi:nucleotide-binding universal stress UspA family protein
VQEAQAHDVTVQAVLVWDLPFRRALAIGLPKDPLAAFRASKEVLTREVSGATGETGHGVVVEPSVLAGRAADVLVDVSADASLLVIGAAGGLRRLGLGSVSRRCTRHARCPTMVVRGNQP